MGMKKKYTLTFREAGKKQIAEIARYFHVSGPAGPMVLDKGEQ
jgi:hypothetical protein